MTDSMATVYKRYSLCITLALIALSAGLSLTYYFRLAISDDYDLVPLLQQWYLGALRWQDLLFISQGHWFFTALLLQIPLAAYSHWNNLYPVTADLLLLLLGWSYIARVAAQTAARAENENIYYLLLPVLTFIFWSLDQSTNFFWGWQVAPVMAVVSAAAVICYLCAEALTARRFLLSMAACAVGIYSYSTGFVLLSIGAALIALHPNLSRRQRTLYLSMWGCFSTATLAHYLIARQAAGETLVWGTPWFYAHFLVNFLASPIARFAHNLSLPILALGCALAGLCLRRFHQTRPEQDWRLWLPWLAFMAFATGCGLMTALGRGAFGIGQATVSRYISFSNFFWIGLMGITLPCAILGGLREIRYKQAMAAVAALLLMKGVDSALVAHKNIRISREYDAVARRIVANYPALDKDIARKISLSPQDLPGMLHVMHEHKLNIFAAENNGNH